MSDSGNNAEENFGKKRLRSKGLTCNFKSTSFRYKKLILQSFIVLSNVLISVFAVSHF